MMRKPLVALGIAATVLMAAAGTTFAAYDEEGFFVFLDAALATAGNTDQVVANRIDVQGIPQTSTQVMPDWGSSPAGRFGFGYEWAGGSKVSVSYWQYDDDEQIAVEGPSGGFLNFAIGPAVYDTYAGVPIDNWGYPGAADFNAGIEASTVDVTFSRESDMGDFLTMEWHVGLRFATYEDRLAGTYDICAAGGCDYGSYDPGDITFDAHKTTEGEMFGARAGFRGTFFLTENLALSSDLSFSMLEGDVTSESGLTPTGLVNAPTNSPTRMIGEDDHRSGNIVEFDVGIQYFILDDRLRFSLGYEHATWNGIVEDLVRNPPGLLNDLDERNSVGFSGYRLGVRYRF